MSVVRRPVLDEYAEDGELVVLLPDGRVLALSPLPSRLLLALDQGSADLDALAAVLVAEFGPAPGDPDGRETTRSVLASLAELGLVDARP